MGSGKSTAGRLLAADLGYRFADADDHIEAREGMKIAEIFRERGEESFRAMELQAILELLGREQTVIATGGGAFANATCAFELRARAFTIHLNCEFPEAWARVAGQTGRPLVEKGESALAALYAERKDKYSRAHATIDTTHRSPEEVAKEVLRLLPHS
jgi:shikimate kinase